MTAADNTNLTTTGPNEDSALTAVQGMIGDADGITTFTPTWQWSVADTGGGAYANITTATAATFTPLQEHVGKFIRVCAAFADDGGNNETRCWTSVAAVANVADRPVGGDSAIMVPDNASSAAPYLFARADFPFSDEDGNTLDGIYIVSVPTRGILADAFLDGSSLSTHCTANPRCIRANNFLDVTEVDYLAYYPDANPAVGAGYATFTYRVRDNGGRATRADEAAEAATLTIDIINSRGQAAAGKPTVYRPIPLLAALTPIGAVSNEDVMLTASVRGITEPNGIDTDTLQWQWYQAPAPASGAPADADYGPIAGATGATFTPLQAQGGMHIRACAFFMDKHAAPASEGGTVASPALCSDAARISSINDAPVSSDDSVTVSIRATENAPYAFKVSDFPYMDEEGDSLTAITIKTLPSVGTLRVGGSPASVDHIVMADNIGAITYYPASDQLAQPNYASFTFTVSDGALSSATHMMTIHLAERLRLRLRVFLEGPLR